MKLDESGHQAEEFKSLLSLYMLYHLFKSESSGRVQTPPLKSNETCLICEFVLKLMSQFALDNATEPEVELVANNY
jgi:hypothetical protein